VATEVRIQFLTPQESTIVPQERTESTGSSRHASETPCHRLDHLTCTIRFAPQLSLAKLWH
jgi:hypothetical protein